MKKVKGLFLAALAAAAMFTSCGTDEDAVAPEITFPNNGGEAVTKKVGDSISFQVDVVKGDNKLEASGVKVSLTMDGVAAVVSGVTTTEATDGFKVIVGYKFEKAGVYVFTIDAADKDGLAATPKTKTVTVEAAGVALTSKGEFTLGAGNNTNGSYYSLAEGVYTSAIAKTKASKVTFVYNFNDTDKAFIMSGSESTVAEIKAGATVTKFAKVTGVTFESATDADIAAVTPSATKITGLAQGDLIAFLAADGTKGLIQVKALVTGVDGTTTVVVKIK